MGVSRLLRSVLVLGLVVLPRPALAQAPPNYKTECLGFDPYKWTRAQIEACLPGSWPKPGFTPYNHAGQPLFAPVKVQPWANVLVGLPGLTNDYSAYLILENDLEPNAAHVIVRGAAQGPIQRMLFLDPNQRLVERLNDWPELQGQLPIGVSIRVRWMKEGNAGIAMHRARDFGSMVQAVEGSGAAVQAWANALVGVDGTENDYGAYLTLENDVNANRVEIVVRGAAQGAFTRVIPMDPNQRLVERLNDWPELQGQLPIGVSVRVRWTNTGNAGVAMHRARDYGTIVQAVEGGGAKPETTP